MSTAGYRIGMRFIKSHVSHWAYSFLSPTQFGGRPGHTTAAATHGLLEHLTAHHRQHHSPHAVFLDVRNAFSSVPFSLMLSLLQHLHFSPGFVHLFQHILHHGKFHLPLNHTEFHASSGIRQGCPLSAMMFVLFYELALRLLAHWNPIAFVDDIAAVTPNSEHAATFINESQVALQRLGLELNIPKSEVLAVGTTSSTTLPIQP